MVVSFTELRKLHIPYWQSTSNICHPRAAARLPISSSSFRSWVCLLFPRNTRRSPPRRARLATSLPPRCRGAANPRPDATPSLARVPGSPRRSASALSVTWWCTRRHVNPTLDVSNCTLRSGVLHLLFRAIVLKVDHTSVRQQSVWVCLVLGVTRV